MRRMSRSASSDVVRSNRLFIGSLIATDPMPKMSLADNPQDSTRNALSASMVSLRTYDQNLLNFARLRLPLVDMSQSAIGTTVAQQSAMNSVSDIQPSCSEPALFYSRLADEMQQRNSIIWNNNRRIWSNIRRMRAQSMDEEEEGNEDDREASVFDSSSLMLSNNTVETELQPLPTESDGKDLRLIHLPIGSNCDPDTSLSEEKEDPFDQHSMESWLRQDRIVSAVDAQQNLFHAYPVIIVDSDEYLSKDIRMPDMGTARPNSIIDVDLEPILSLHSNAVVVPHVESESEEDVKRVLGTSALDVTVLAACLNAEDSVGQRKKENEIHQLIDLENDQSIETPPASRQTEMVSARLQSMQTLSDRSLETPVEELLRDQAGRVRWQPQFKNLSNLTRSQSTVPNLDESFSSDSKCQKNTSTPNLKL